MGGRGERVSWVSGGSGGGVSQWEGEGKGFLGYRGVGGVSQWEGEGKRYQGEGEGMYPSGSEEGFAWLIQWFLGVSV